MRRAVLGWAMYETEQMIRVRNFGGGFIVVTYLVTRYYPDRIEYVEYNRPMCGAL